MDILKPYRRRIDKLDSEIVGLLRKRYDVIEEVAHLKAREGIEAVLQDRVDEVRENAARMAAEQNLDESFIRKLYAQIIEHSCDLEEIMKKKIYADQKEAS